jgi:hypothetical protein
VPPHGDAQIADELEELIRLSWAPALPVELARADCQLWPITIAAQNLGTPSAIARTRG